MIKHTQATGYVTRTETSRTTTKRQQLPAVTQEQLLITNTVLSNIADVTYRESKGSYVHKKFNLLCGIKKVHYRCHNCLLLDLMNHEDTHIFTRCFC